MALPELTPAEYAAWVAAGAAVIAAVAAILTWLVYRRQAKIMARQAEISEGQRDLAEKQTELTGRLVGLEESRQSGVLVAEEFSIHPSEGPHWYRMFIMNTGGHATGIRHVSVSTRPVGAEGASIFEFDHVFVRNPIYEAVKERHGRNKASLEYDAYIAAPELTISPGSRVEVFLRLHENFPTREMGVRGVITPVLGTPAAFHFQGLTNQGWEENSDILRELRDDYDPDDAPDPDVDEDDVP